MVRWPGVAAAAGTQVAGSGKRFAVAGKRVVAAGRRVVVRKPLAFVVQVCREDSGVD